MLVLTRTPHQKIVIDGPCEIELLDIRANKVRLGITADKSVSIMRSELLERKPAADEDKLTECG